MTVPKTGGLTFILVTSFNCKTVGKPSTLIHLLPIEVLAFLSVTPYFFINQKGGSHAFWTILASLMNFKTVTQKWLETTEREGLEYVLTKLKVGDMVNLLCAINSTTDEDLVPLCLETLRHPKFRLLTAGLGNEGVDLFCDMWVNLIFLMKFKLVNFEAKDDFIHKAEIMPQSVPTIVKPVFGSTFKLDFPCGEKSNSSLLCQTSGETEMEPRTHAVVRAPSVSPEKPKRSYQGEPCKHESPAKKSKVVLQNADTFLQTPVFEGHPLGFEPGSFRLSDAEEFDVAAACEALFNDAVFDEGAEQKTSPEIIERVPQISTDLKETEAAKTPSKEPPPENVSFTQDPREDSMSQCSSIGSPSVFQFAQTPLQAVQEAVVIEAAPPKQHFDFYVNSEEKKVTVVTDSLSFSFHFQ